jgi:hypothetical protein
MPTYNKNDSSLGQSVSLRITYANACFPGLAWDVVDQGARLGQESITADVVSLTPATLLKLRHGVVGEAFEGSPMFLRGHHPVAGSAALPPGVASLFELAQLNGPEDDPCQPIPAIPQQEIAAIAGLSRGQPPR